MKLSAESIAQTCNIKSPDPNRTGEYVSVNEAVPDSPPGYTILDKLGLGGMGVVYKARHEKLNRFVALKMVLGTDRLDEKALIRFLSEAEAVAAVKHPHVVDVYEYGEHEGRPYLVLEFLSGGSLERRLSSMGCLSPAIAASYVEKISLGVQAAHDVQIVHRDLKPGNVLFDDKGEPKVTDFGLAKRGLGENLTQTRAVLGTPAYMSPEQAKGESKFVGPTADVWALGVILYECLTGRRPFQSEDNWSLLQQVISSEPDRPRSLVPKIPRDMELICLKCLAKDGGDRYPTAASLAADLRRYMEGKPVTARPISPLFKCWRWVRRHPIPTSLLLLLSALLFGLPPYIVWNNSQIESSRLVAGEADRARISAEIAQAESEKAAEAAAKLARTREYFAILSKLRQRQVDHSPGWTWEAAPELHRLSELISDHSDRSEARTLALAVLTSWDFRPAGMVAQGLTAGAIAISPDNRFLAVAEHAARAIVAPVRIAIVNPASGQNIRTLSFLPAIGLKGASDVPVGKDGARAAVFSSDNRYLFIASRAGVVHKWDLSRESPGPIKSGALQTSTPSISLSSDGRLLYAAGANGIVCSLATDTLEQVTRATLPEKQSTWHDYSVASAPGPTKELVAFACGGQLRCVESSTLKDRATRTFQEGVINKIRFSPQGRYLAVANKWMLHILEAESLATGGQLTDPSLQDRAHASDITSLEISQSGDCIATASSSQEDRTIKLWEAASGRLVGTYQLPGQDAICLAWSPDGLALFASTADRVMKFSVKKPAHERVPSIQSMPIIGACFSPHNDILSVDRHHIEGEAGVSSVFCYGPVHSWNHQHVTPGSGLRGTNPSLAVDPHSGLVASAGGRYAIDFLDLTSGKSTWAIIGDTPSDPRFSPDGKLLWFLNDRRTVHCYDLTQRKKLAEWSNAIGTVLSGYSGITTIVAHTGGLLVGCRDGNVVFLKPPSPSIKARSLVGLLPTAQRTGVTAIATNANGSICVVGNQDGIVQFLSIESTISPQILKAHVAAITTLAYSDRGQVLVTGCQDRSLKFWKKERDTWVANLVCDCLPAPARSLEFDTSGTKLLILLKEERGVRVWDLNQLHVYLAHENLDD